MPKIIACINMTLDGYCDHTAVGADEETHQHYSDLVRSAGILFYGRITYQLMESYWPEVVKNPTGVRATDEFAKSIDDVPKIVFSRTLDKVVWRNSQLKHELIPAEILELKEQAEKDLYVGSPSMIVAFAKLDLIDEYQLCIHPVIVGSGLVLFKDITDRIELKLLRTKTFTRGAVVHYYEPVMRYEV
jgi:dihydrofolate reductase